MAKVQFNKLKCKYEDKVETIVFNGETIEVKQYLPIQEKLGLIGRVIMNTHEQDYNFASPVKVEVITTVEIIMAYTNISFTDKQKDDIAKLYDMMDCAGLIKTIIAAIPEDELQAIYRGVNNTVKSFYDYQNSLLGILDNIKANKDKMEFSLDMFREAMGEISDPESLKLLKDIAKILE